MGILRFFNRNLGAKLNLVFIIAFGTLLVALIVAVYVSLESFSVQTGRQRVEQEAQIVNTRFAESERELLANAKVLARTPGLAEAVTNRDVQQIRTLLLVNSAPYDLDDMEVVDTEGERILGITEDDHTFDSNQKDALFTLALIGSEANGLIFIEENQEIQARLAAVITLRATSGEIVGGLLVSNIIDDEFLSQISFNRPDIQLALMSKGHLLAQTTSIHGQEERDDLVGILDVLLDETALNRALNGQTIMAEDIILSDNGSSHALAYVPLTVGGDTQSVIGVLANLDELFAFQRRLIISISFIFLLLALGMVVVVTRFVRSSVSVPINKLKVATERMADSNYDQRVEIASADEVGQLADAFNGMAAKLQISIGSLEQSTRRLGIVAAITERLTAILNLEALLIEIVDRVKEDFGYYHAHIYLLDEDKELLTIAAGTGEAGKEMVARGHNIAFNAQASLVARAARSGTVANINNVRETPDWLPNKLLPDTYSEMAVPIILEGHVVGVLDVQQDKIAGFNEGDIELLRSLAGQVAIAIRNARLFEDVQARLAEANAIQQQYVKDSWRDIVASKQDIGQIKFSLGESTTLSNNAINQARKLASKIKTPTVINLDDRPDEAPLETSTGTGTGSDSKHALVAPILLRNVTIGNLQFHDVDPTRKWTESEMALIEAIIDQVAQTAENLRLLADAQERAGREQLIGQIGDKLRSVPDIESLMEVAVNELSQVLNPARTFVEFAPEVMIDSANLQRNSEATDSTLPNQMAEIEADSVSEIGSNQYRGYGDNVNGQT